MENMAFDAAKEDVLHFLLFFVTVQRPRTWCAHSERIILFVFLAPPQKKKNEPNAVFLR
jgi:hypothetical protein